MSILLRPSCSVSESLFLTCAAAVAVARSAEKLSGKKTGIKWVNDVLTDGKKIAGILTEGSVSVESGGLDFAVVGIGINVFEPPGGFCSPLREIATSVFDTDFPERDLRSMLAAEIIDSFMFYYKNLDGRSFYREYKKRSVVIGREVVVIGHGENRPARVLDIDDSCRLHVLFGDGTQGLLSSGEISVQLSEGGCFL